VFAMVDEQPQPTKHRLYSIGIADDGPWAPGQPIPPQRYSWSCACGVIGRGPGMWKQGYESYDAHAGTRTLVAASALPPQVIAKPRRRKSRS
jgi:hypothetical protein